MNAEHDILRLDGRAKLRVDKRSGETFLLYPERGLRLNATAAEILRLCDSVRTYGDIVRVLSQRYGRKASELRVEVSGFLDALAERGLLRVLP